MKNKLTNNLIGFSIKKYCILTTMRRKDEEEEMNSY